MGVGKDQAKQGIFGRKIDQLREVAWELRLTQCATLHHHFPAQVDRLLRRRETGLPWGHQRRTYYLTQTVNNFRDKPVSFLWAEAGDHQELQDQFSLYSGFPSVLLINSQRRVFSIMKSSFTEENFEEWLKDILNRKGGRRFGQYSKSLTFGNVEEAEVVTPIEDVQINEGDEFAQELWFIQKLYPINQWGLTAPSCLSHQSRIDLQPDCHLLLSYQTCLIVLQRNLPSFDVSSPNLNNASTPISLCVTNHLCFWQVASSLPSVEQSLHLETVALWYCWALALDGWPWNQSTTFGRIVSSLSLPWVITNFASSSK